MAIHLEDALQGVSAVLVTPFRTGNGAVDEDVLTELAGRCDDAGIHVIVALGNTAEVYQLTRAEQSRVLRVVEARRNGAALLAGLSGPLATQLELAEEAASLGFDGAMVHEPPDPLASGDGIRELLLEQAERSALPLVLYVRTQRLSTDDLLALASHRRIVGVKYAVRTGDPAAVLAARQEDDCCVWVCGLAESHVPAFAALGVRGFTSGLANVRPDLALGFHAAVRHGDGDEVARRLAEILPFELLRNADAGRYNVAAVKAALRRHGIEAGDVRPPCASLDHAAAARLEAALALWPTQPVVEHA